MMYENCVSKKEKHNLENMLFRNDKREKKTQEENTKTKQQNNRPRM